MRAKLRGRRRYKPRRPRKAGSERRTCGIDGDRAAPDDHRLQNRAKNGLCATNNSQTIRVTRWSFDQLQTSVNGLTKAGDFTRRTARLPKATPPPPPATSRSFSGKCENLEIHLL